MLFTLSIKWRMKMAYRKPNKQNRRIALALQEDLYDQFNLLAQKNKRCLSDMMRIVMAEAIEFDSKKSETITE